MSSFFTSRNLSIIPPQFKAFVQSLMSDHEQPGVELCADFQSHFGGFQGIEWGKSKVSKYVPEEMCPGFGILSVPMTLNETVGFRNGEPVFNLKEWTRDDMGYSTECPATCTDISTIKPKGSSGGGSYVHRHQFTHADDNDPFETWEFTLIPKGTVLTGAKTASLAAVPGVKTEEDLL